MKSRSINKVLFVAFIASILIASPSFAGSNPNGKTPNENAIGYWTQDRLDNALTRDFEFEPGANSGKLVSLGKPSRGGGGTTTAVTGSNWTKGGKPLNSTGKVFFTMGGTNYVCSGALANENVSGRSVVLTAGHCVWDNATSSWATNFIFIPAYDSNPVNNCSTTPGRCLVASALTASSGFTTQTSFTTQATLNDWGFAVVTESTQPGFNLAINSLASSNTVYAFGYPAASPYNGSKLIYCAGPISADSKNGGLTWGLGCNMTGGASGGPWLGSFNTSTNDGNLASLNSYKYNNDSTKMYGPKFNAATQSAFLLAQTVTINTVS